MDLSSEENIFVSQPCRDNTLYLLRLVDEMLSSEIDLKLPVYNFEDLMTRLPLYLSSLLIYTVCYYFSHPNIHPPPTLLPPKNRGIKMNVLKITLSIYLLVT